jgi:hypothetical protein
VDIASMNLFKQFISASFPDALKTKSTVRSRAQLGVAQNDTARRAHHSPAGPAVRAKLAQLSMAKQPATSASALGVLFQG